MRIEQFEQFIALAHHQHFRKAAEVSNLSTSALTRSIQTLELDLGCDLLTRSTRSVKLTPAGEVFLQYCQQALDNHALLQQKLSKFASNKNEKIVIGYSPEAIGLVPQACGKFMQKFPNISIEMQLQDADTLAENVRNGQLDLAINSPITANTGKFINLPEQVVLFCHKDHPILKSSNIQLPHLNKLPILATVSTNQALSKLINQAASNLNKLDSLRLGTFEQIVSKLNDCKHIALTTLDMMQKISNDESLVNLSASMERNSTLTLELQVAKNNLSAPNVSELLNFITLEANTRPEIALAKATF
ncbi:LysR family transcriptional regulator [Pseudoalteromonas sp. G4]|uniref:LysR family transcriptional regulator n=1 Tax=Pseudoalteromonas sp. G4 TaxID=2992761 RepID=UPI00237DB18C|nr:LysR family transcriptional regulator [Pseudoalteromonas sp. G4]MDE3272951.1 LysR family transcriptional regulator [Pseudoalteromonas sp. G4]